MKEQDKKIQELLKGNFSNEEPSLDFTNSVMDNILQIQADKEKSFVYTPVISKLGWSIICAFFIGILFAISNSTAHTWDLNKYSQMFKLDFSLLQSPIVCVSIISVFLLLLVEKSLRSYKRSSSY